MVILDVKMKTIKTKYIFQAKNVNKQAKYIINLYSCLSNKNICYLKMHR